MIINKLIFPGLSTTPDVAENEFIPVSNLTSKVVPAILRRGVLVEIL